MSPACISHRLQGSYCYKGSRYEDHSPGAFLRCHCVSSGWLGFAFSILFFIDSSFKYKLLGFVFGVFLRGIVFKKAAAPVIPAFGREVEVGGSL